MVGPMWGPSFVEKGVLKMNNNSHHLQTASEDGIYKMRRILTRGPNITLMNIKHMFIPIEEKMRLRYGAPINQFESWIALRIFCSSCKVFGSFGFCIEYAS